MKTSAMQRTMRMAIVLLLLAYAPALWAQHHGRGRAAFDEVFIDLRQPGKLEKEFPKEKIEQVRVLHLRGPLNSDDMRFVKRLADRSKVVDEKGDKVEAYLDLDMEEARLADNKYMRWFCYFVMFELFLMGSGQELHVTSFLTVRMVNFIVAVAISLYCFLEEV